VAHLILGITGDKDKIVWFPGEREWGLQRSRRR